MIIVFPHTISIGIFYLHTTNRFIHHSVFTITNLPAKNVPPTLIFKCQFYTAISPNDFPQLIFCDSLRISIADRRHIISTCSHHIQIFDGSRFISRFQRSFCIHQQHICITEENIICHSVAHLQIVRSIHGFINRFTSVVSRIRNVTIRRSINLIGTTYSYTSNNLFPLPHRSIIQDALVEAFLTIFIRIILIVTGCRISDRQSVGHAIVVNQFLCRLHISPTGLYSFYKHRTEQTFTTPSILLRHLEVEDHFIVIVGSFCPKVQNSRLQMIDL